MNYLLRIKEVLEQGEGNLTYLSGLPDTRLQKKLAIVHLQMEIALTNNQSDALELLRVWERQIIEARILKHEQQPEKNELSEMEKELAEMDAFDAEIERRQRVLQKPLPQRIEEPENEITQDEVAEDKPKPDQLKLF